MMEQAPGKAETEPQAWTFPTCMPWRPVGRRPVGQAL